VSVLGRPSSLLPRSPADRPVLRGRISARPASLRVSATVRSMRPKQWTKNLILFAPLLFSQSLADPHRLPRTVVAGALFCLLSGAVYLADDIGDVRRDRFDAVKRHRPLAAGELEPPVAVAAAPALATLAIGGGFAFSAPLGLLAVAYLGLQIGYVLVLKDVVILDVVAISAGFVFRVVAGAVVIGVASSPWLLLCTALLALFLALIKRRHELRMNGRAVEHRPVLRHYSVALLDQMISSVTSATIVTYSIYAFMSREAAGRPYLMVTIPFVGYGLLRYLYLAHQHEVGGSPEDVLLADKPLVVDLVLWVAAVVIVLYVV